MKVYGINFSNGKNGGMPAFLASVSGISTFLMLCLLLEEDARLLPGICLSGAAAVLSALASLVLWLRKRRKRRGKG